MEAAKSGNIEKLKKEIEEKAWINRSGPEGLTALMFAAKNGHTDALSILLDAGADPNSTSDYGWTALTFASRYGYKNIAEELLKAGANPNINSSELPSAFSTTGNYPETNALTEAIQKDVSIARTLLKHGALIDQKAASAAVWAEDLDLLEYFWQKKGVFSQGIFPAIGLNTVKTTSLKWLLEKGVDPNSPCAAICDSTKMYFSHLSE